MPDQRLSRFLILPELELNSVEFASKFKILHCSKSGEMKYLIILGSSRLMVDPTGIEPVTSNMPC